METNKIFSVSDANRYIKNILEQDLLLSRLYITGEITNLKHYSIGGQIYFTLKDTQSQLNCVMFESTVKQLKFKPEDGMKVNVLGRISVFEKKGYYNLQVFAIEPIGLGPLALAFEQLKRKLQQAGLFDQEIKRPLPPYPESIGIISSPSGAALWDIVSVARRRAPYVRLYLYPAIVQGEKAPASLIAALDNANQHKKANLLLLARGGGSFEELFVFNDENLAHAIRRSAIPVVSAVGHEVDITIADFVADLRAPTPSAAAELLLGDRRESITQIDNIAKDINTLMTDLIADQRLMLDGYQESLKDSIQDLYSRNEQQLAFLLAKLEALNPLSILRRGYSVTTLKEKVVKSIQDCQLGDTLLTRVADGSIRANVFQISKN